MDDSFRATDADQGRVARALKAGPLERGYRRLLFFYPAAYRRVHEEEMLAVLMTAAPGGKRRPGIAEVADLIWGALRVRFQPSQDGAEPAWREALAVLSVILPVIMLVIFSVREARVLLTFPAPGAFSYGFPLWAIEAPTAAFILVALVLLRLRRAAALAAAAMVLWVAFLSGGSTYFYVTADAYLFLALGLEIAALVASPGPRRGLQILTWKHGALVVIATLAVATTSYPVTLIVIAVICTVMALASSLGRRLLVLLAIQAWPFFVPPEWTTPWQLLHLAPAPGIIGQTYLPPAVLLGVFIMAARRESLRSSPIPPASR
jgi:hypothetical protein